MSASFSSTKYCREEVSSCPTSEMDSVQVRDLQCIDTNSYSEPVNAIRQPSAGKSITVHASRKTKKPLTPPSVYTRINPSTREPCSQYMTTASSSPGSAAPDCYGTHYTQLLSAAGQQDTAGNNALHCLVQPLLQMSRGLDNLRF